jgi:hypothetical protein
MTTRHPTRRRLQRWLDTGGPRRVESHVEACEHCQQILDELTVLDEATVADLQVATTPPQDLHERTTGGVDARLRDEAALTAFADLFTIGWDVVRAVVDPVTTDRGAAQEPPSAADDPIGGPS